MQVRGVLVCGGLYGEFGEGPGEAVGVGVRWLGTWCGMGIGGGGAIVIRALPVCDVLPSVV